MTSSYLQNTHSENSCDPSLGSVSVGGNYRTGNPSFNFPVIRLTCPRKGIVVLLDLLSLHSALIASISSKRTAPGHYMGITLEVKA